MVWVVAANVVTIERGPADGPSYRGTKLFRAGAKVYLANMGQWWSLEDEKGRLHTSFEVIGQHRLSRKWIKCWVNGSALQHWRVAIAGNAGAVRLLEREGWWGFRIAPHEFSWDGEKYSVGAIRALFEAVRLRLPPGFRSAEE